MQIMLIKLAELKKMSAGLSLLGSQRWIKLVGLKRVFNEDCRPQLGNKR